MKHLLSFIICTCSLIGQATQWTVGTGQTYTLPSQVAPMVNDGDTVNILAGTYPSDVTNWTADDLLLRGVGGFAQLESNGVSWGDKAIWVIQGDRTTVEWIEFSECTSTAYNGAGIRQEGHHLTVRNCIFRDNENGILAGSLLPSTIRIERCEFDHNGHGDGFSHNLYINHVDSLIFRYNYSHHAHVGHELKSRAHVNVIEYNRFSNEATGDASREIDLPNGGTTYMIGNVIQQGPMGQNSNLVGYGLEGLTNPVNHEFYVINNTLVNEKTVGSFLSIQNGNVFFKAYNNILAGGGSMIAGAFPSFTDTVSNLRGTITAMVFQDPATYNYHLSPSSPALSAGFPAGLAQNGYPLVAWEEYVHPTSSTVRCQHATLDVGAFEGCTTGIGYESEKEPLSIWPVPSDGLLFVHGVPFDAAVSLLDVHGALVEVPSRRGSDRAVLDVSGLAPGVYLLRIGTRTSRVVVQ
ncbi:MAG: T9SS type A sorting domain-containing protein [Flavobacteriales bacterium]|nr:T9SS type A sorting domain-containing protein [Flavobacteriales bacterium]